MQTIINILVFFVILGAIVLIHELGHFLTAKLFGVYCAEFSIGMGPKLFSKKKGETDYQIRALPIGGYVAMAGEADQEDSELMKDVPYERTLNKRLAISFAPFKTHGKLPPVFPARYAKESA